MLKSLTSIRFFVVFLLSVICSFGIQVLDLPIDLFYAWLISFFFLVLLMEIGRLIVNQVVKKEQGTFIIFGFSYLVFSFVLASVLISFLTLEQDVLKKIQLYLGLMVLTIGVFQGVYFWIRKNAQERLRLVKEKQRYLQHSFNALKSQNVIEFLQESLSNTAELIHKDEEKALIQIEKLTSILRYLLQSRDERFVKLGDELSNVKEYCELAEIQFDNKVELSINISDGFYNTQIPPLVFQLILDNQFKVFASRNEPVLKIEVYIENNKFVVVKTSLPMVENVSKNEKFINNLKQRYQLYNKASGVSELSTNSEYFVKFPLVAG